KSHSSAAKAMSTSRDNREDPLPLWSRLLDHNADGQHRKKGSGQSDHYEVEIANRLWSLWGTLRTVEPRTSQLQAEQVSVSGRSSELQAVHPTVPGRILACCVIACCAGSFLDLDSWDARLLDSIMECGQEYYDASLVLRQRRDPTGDLALETLHTSCCLEAQQFWVDTEKLVCGKLYSRTKSLGWALSLFFGQQFQTGILQVKDQALAFGFIPEFSAGGAFFMFHCQASGKPLFKDSERAPYVLRMRQLQQLLYCILITLDERQRKVPFRIYKVACVPKT
ncbi:hypothetical protein KR026_007474, partial [Drosophila bipectinata]